MEAVQSDLLKKTLEDRKEAIPMAKIDTTDKRITTIEMPDGKKIAFSNKELKDLLAKLYIN